jgi:hypothetical protein
MINKALQGGLAVLLCVVIVLLLGVLGFAWCLGVSLLVI